MAIDNVKLNESARMGLVALRCAAERVRARAQPVEAQFARALPKGKSDEVLVVVVGPEGVLLSRSKVRRQIGLRELRLRLAGAEAAVETLAARPALVGGPALAAAEASVLDDAGFTEGEPDELGALARSRIQFELLLRDSMSLEQAAKALDVSTSRLRQRLSAHERTLYGFKEGRLWRIPKFQFEKKGKLVRGIDKVMTHVRDDANALAVTAWFSNPHQDLVVGADDEPVAPIAWLSAGGSVEEVARLAEEI